jgi:phosphatidylcholine synthase
VPPLLASCYGFAQTQAKTDDDYFLGFPSYWSLIGFYLYVFDTPIWFNTALILFLAVMVFVPVRYPYPTKTPQLRTVTLVLGALTGAAMLAVVATLPDPPRWLAWTTLVYPAYYGLLTIGLSRRRRTVPA